MSDGAQTLMTVEELQAAANTIAQVGVSVCRRDGGKVQVIDVMNCLVQATAISAANQCTAIGATPKDFGQLCTAISKAFEEELELALEVYQSDWGDHG